LLLLIGVLLANIIARYSLGGALVWAQEAAIWLFIALIFLGMPLAHRHRQHLALTVFIHRLPTPLRHGSVLCVDAVVTCVTFMLLFGGVDLITRIGGISPALGVPLWLKFALIPLSAGISVLYIAGRGIDSDQPLWHGPVALLSGGLLYLAVQPQGWLSLATDSASLVMLLAFAVTLLLGVPVAFAMLFAVLVSGLSTPLLPPAALVQNLVNGVGKFLLLAIPLFLTAGALMNAGGLSRRLLDFAFSLVGHWRGGYGQVSVVSSLLYGGISGSSYSEAALSAKLLVPQMIRQGYSPAFACAITASSGILPNLIPPSIALLIVAAVANLSVAALWFAGIGPGVLIAVCLMLAVYWRAPRQGATPRATLGQIARSGLHVLPVLALVGIILGGTRFGLVTPTEAGVLAVVYAGFLGLGVYREYGCKTLYRALSQAAQDAALVGLLIGAAAPFAFILVAEHIPQTLIEWLSTWTDQPMVLLLLVNVLLLLFGMVLDIGAALLILTPLLMPLAAIIGIDPVHFAVIIVVNLMLGGLTPPIGMLAFVTATVTGTPVHFIFRALWPFLLVLLVALLLIIFIPAIAIGGLL
jgi:tripartite ATP-independent transporter DctM subunit